MDRPYRHVVVIGPGAVGCVLAVRLARMPDAPAVTLLDRRPDRAARLSARPLHLRSPRGDVEAAVPVRTRPDSPPDLVLLATKAPDARAAAAGAAPWIGPAPLVAFQNGLGAPAEVARALPGTPVVTAVTYLAAHLLAEGVVRHVASLAIHLGYEVRPPDAAVRAVADLLARAGFPAEVEADVTPRVWAKLVVNAALNPVAALAGVPNGHVAARPALRALAVALAEEAEAVARAAGVRLPGPPGCDAALDTARRTADNLCSMLQDLQARRPTEIEYLSGAVTRLAGPLGVPVPAHRAVAALVRQVSSPAAGHTPAAPDIAPATT